MDAIQEMLEVRANDIIDEALGAIRGAHLKHYEAAGLPQTRQRLELLYRLTRECVQKRNLTPIIHHAERIANERFSAGYDLGEIQIAFNVLEEVIWKHALSELEPAEFSRALGLVSTVLGAGKDALARTYVSLACGTKVPSLNLAALFELAH